MVQRTNRPAAEVRASVRDDRDPTTWIKFYGYDTYVLELSRIFDTNHGTLRQRLAAGWAMEAALLLPARSGYTAVTSSMFANQESVKKEVQKIMDDHFHPRPAKSKVGRPRKVTK